MKKNTRKGFTLIEILVVLMIMLGLMAIIAGDVSQMMAGNDLGQGKSVLQDAFIKARSRAVTLEKTVGVYMSFRTFEDQPEAKLWVVVGGVKDNDLANSPTEGELLDENDFYDFKTSTTVSKDDSILPISYKLPFSLYLHGIQENATDNQGKGKFVRWYAVFSPDGSCQMIRPDGDDTAAQPGSPGAWSAWSAVNDYLPEGYHFSGTVTSVIDSNIGELVATDPLAVLMKSIRDDAINPKGSRSTSTLHHLKLFSDTDEKYFILYTGSGRLVEVEE